MTPSSRPPAPLQPLGPRTRAALQRSLRTMAVLWLVISLLSGLAGGGLYGGKGLISAALVAGVGLLLIVITTATHRAVLNRPELSMAWMGMDFLGKLGLLIGAVALTRKTALFEANLLFFALLAMVICFSVGMSVALARSHVPLLDPPDSDKKQ